MSICCHDLAELTTLYFSLQLTISQNKVLNLIEGDDLFSKFLFSMLLMISQNKNSLSQHHTIILIFQFEVLKPQHMTTYFQFELPNGGNRNNINFSEHLLLNESLVFLWK